VKAVYSFVKLTGLRVRACHRRLPSNSGRGWNYVFKAAITNMATARNFEAMSVMFKVILSSRNIKT
jgi:hypothetical protein